MTRKTLAWAMGIFLLAAAFAAVGYHEATKSGMGDDDRLLVIVTIAPQVEFAERVGGDLVRVTSMVPPGKSPHDYEPTPSQMKDVTDADLYFKVGSGVEFEKVWMDRLKGQNGDMAVVDGSEGVTFIDFDGEPLVDEHGDDHDDDGGVEDSDEHDDDGGVEEGENHADDEGEDDPGATGSEDDGHDDHDHTGADPHIWMSIRNAVTMVENLRDGLEGEDPENAGEYRDNADEYIAELEALDAEMAKDLESHAGDAFLVYHPAFGYFAHDYGLVQMAIEDEGKEPGSAGLAAVIEQAKDNDIRAVFVEPQFDQSSAQTIKEEIGGDVIVLNSLPENYLKNMREVSSKLVTALS